MTKLVNRRNAELYERAVSVEIANPLNGIPRISYNLEDAIIEPDGTQVGLGFKGSRLQDDLIDPAESFVGINPLDGSPLGNTFDVATLQTIITSHYYYMEEKSKVRAYDDAIQMADSQIQYYTNSVARLDAQISGAEEPELSMYTTERAEDQQRVDDAIAAKAQAETDRAAFILTTENTFV